MVLFIFFCRFPLKNIELTKKWLVAIRRQKWHPKPTDFICSEHFASSSFRMYSSQRRLKEDAVPEIFDFPPHLKKKEVRNHRALERNAVSSSATTVSDIVPEQTVTQSTSGLSCNSLLSSGSVTDHSYAVTQSPRSIKRKYEELLEKEKLQRSLMAKKFAVTRRKLFRKETKLQTMKDIIKQLRSRTDINATSVDLIERCFGQVPCEMLKRKLYSSVQEPYNDTLRSFAMTLHFYSAKAYEFVRRSFCKSLPHPSTIRTWHTSVDGRPGFTAEAFEVCYFSLKCIVYTY